MKAILSGAAAILLLACSGCNRVDILEIRKEGEEIVLEIQKLQMEMGEAPERTRVIDSGIDLSEWRYAKMEDDAFMLWRSLGLGKSCLKYQSGATGKPGSGWCVEDESGNEEWLP